VEVDILSQALEGWEPAAAYDTLKIARRLFPAEEKHGLEHLGSKLGSSPRAGKITGGKAHSAPFDAVLSALLSDHMSGNRTEDDRRAILTDADILRSAQGSLLAVNAQDKGFPILAKHTFESTAWSMARAIESEAEATLSADVILVDRPVADALGYLQAALRHTSRSIAPARLEASERICAAWAPEYDLAFSTV
ncbi:hypothetical protein OY671_008982, partial [Metschnikowia pulcherrima]